MDKESQPLRESIWTVARERAKVYFAVFSTMNIMNTARVVWFETTQAQHADWSLMTDAVWDGIGRGALGIAGASIAITDTWRFTMVLAAMFEDWVNRRRERHLAEAVAKAVAEATAEVRAETRAEATAEATAETNALWRAWNGRRLDALANGEPFDEPPPDDIAEPSANGRGER